MKSHNFVRFVAILCVGLMLPMTGPAAWAEEKNEVDIEGRVYDFDQDKPLHGVTVRIVGAKTGQAREDETDKNGCYEFDDVAADTYSLSTLYKGDNTDMAEKVRGEFLLPTQLTVTPSPEKDILIKTCVSLAERNSLLLMEDCDLCNKVPPLVWVIPAGLVVAGSIIGRDDDEETSPSRP